MQLTREQLDHAAGIARLYGAAYIGDTDQDGAALIGPPTAMPGHEAACEWIRLDGTVDQDLGGPVARYAAPDMGTDPALSGR